MRSLNILVNIVKLSPRDSGFFILNSKISSMLEGVFSYASDGYFS